jgi:undecaprenyl-diphosphatase
MAGSLRGQMDAFDKAVDRALDPLRGHPRVEATARVVSNLADYGFVWSLLAAAKGRRRGPARRRALQALTLAGFSSLGVNAVVKQVVSRQRPEGALQVGDDERLWVRTPTSSSFPSGHTLAAFCTAVMLAESPSDAVLYLGFASSVAASRVYLRHHFASDVVGGAAIGAAVGLTGRKLVPRPRQPRRRRSR